MTKRIKALILSVVMVLSMLAPLSAFADEMPSGLDKILIIYNMNHKTNNSKTYYPIHIYSGIDSLNYREVGFDVTVSNSNTEQSISKATTVVYTAMNVMNSSGTITKYTAQQLSGNYMFGQELLFAAGKWFNEDTVIEVTPYALKTDGSKIPGKTITVSDEILKQNNPDSRLFKEVTQDEDEKEDGSVIASGSTDVTVTEDNKVSGDGVTITADTVSAEVPGGVALQDGATELTLSLSELNESASGVETGDTEVLSAYDVHIDGVAENNDVPITVTINDVVQNGLNNGNISVYHVEDGNTVEMERVASLDELTGHNQFAYEPSDGTLTLSLASFSEVALVADTTKAWKGEYDYSWYTDGVTTYSADAPDYTIANADQLAAFSAIVGGMNGQTQDSFKDKTITLLSDINLADKESENNPDLIFYPIGYYNSTKSYERPAETTEVTSNVSSFEGTFDGNGHTISNFYQNTWEMFGDYNSGYNGTPNYYKDAMGLFGYVYGGTVKNLTIDHFSSDGEFTPTGCVAAFADGDATFENIALTNCNPRVYNTGNGGIIGIAGDTSAENDDHITLTNITVDNSNKISALWGSWDVACGGLVGMYRGNVDGNGEATGDTISFNNCHVAAQIDVYNDVCANYQYYAYRYAGMIIGSVRHNTTNDDGKTIPNMEGISASSCTVNYGDWNDYYYCEFEKNSMASYSEDYQFSRVDKSEITFDENGNITGCIHEHTTEEDKTAVYLPFHQLFTGYSWGVSSIGLEKYSGIVTDLDISEGEQEKSVEKFESKFTGDFLYRVGNQNAVSLSSLFAEKTDATINNSGVYVTIDKIDEDSNVSGTWTPSTAENWYDGTIQFSGTGPVKVTIQDYNYCTPTVLYLEVVDATNVTTATSATKNNVVLLNDCGFSSLEVLDGYALYGNGFTMTCSSDSAALDFGYSFVTLKDGTLDNVQIVCPNFDYAALYKSNLTSADNRSETDANGKTRYYNAKSGVIASGNSQILNSRISGARAALNVSGGNIVVDSSRIELGAVASILVGAANSLTLRYVTLVQEPTASTYDSTKTLMGFSVLCICNSEGIAAPITIEDGFIQYAWVDETAKQYVPSTGSGVINSALTQKEYLHDLDGDGTKESLNLGFAYMPESNSSTVQATSITDNRTDKSTIPYDYANINYSGIDTYVYSYKNTNGTDDSFKNETVYVPNKYSDIVDVSYSDTSDGLTTGKTYGTDGWVYELNVDLDKLSGYELDFSKLTMKVNGVAVSDFKVNGSAKPTSPVAVTAGGTTYTLTATVNETEYTATFKVTGTETSKESPSLVASNYEAALLVGEAGSTFSKDTWHGAAPVLNGIQIKYWSVAEKQYKTITLSDYTPTTAGKQNGTAAVWTYSPENNDFTLTIKNETAVHSSNSVFAMPVVVNNKLYFVASGSNGLVNYGNSARTIKINYYFNDNNGGEELKFDYTWSIECANGNTCYDYSDFCNGTSKTFTIKSSNGNVCVTGDTLVTLADGTQKRIDEVTYNDTLKVWDFEKGEYTTAPPVVIRNHGFADNTVITLTFSDGTITKAVNEHGYYDSELRKFVAINGDNAEEFIGHSFVKENENGYTTVVLEDVDVTEEYVEAWSVLTASYQNFIGDDFFSIGSSVRGLDYAMPFENGDDLKIDAEKKAADIEKYGLFTYEEFLNILAEEGITGTLTEEQFYALKLPQVKVAIGKGIITYDDFIVILKVEVFGQ